MFEGPVQDLIDELGKLPGIGPKSAQRIAFHLISVEPPDIDRLVVPDPVATMPFVMAAVREIRAALGGRVPVVVGPPTESLDQNTVRHGDGTRRRSAWGARQFRSIS